MRVGIQGAVPDGGLGGSVYGFRALGMEVVPKPGTF